MAERLFLVGVAGFEPTTSCTPSKRATGLRYTPIPVNWDGKGTEVFLKFHQA